MKNYKYDYDRTCFKVLKNIDDELKYYIKVNFEYIEVSREIFKICRHSYDKIRKDEKKKVDRSILNFKDIDQSTFLLLIKKLILMLLNISI